MRDKKELSVGKYQDALKQMVELPIRVQQDAISMWLARDMKINITDVRKKRFYGAYNSQVLALGDYHRSLKQISPVFFDAALQSEIFDLPIDIVSTRIRFYESN